MLMRLFIKFLFLAVWVCAPLHASTLEKLGASEEATLLYADSIVHERELGLVVARGNVEIIRGARTLYADVVTYNQQTNTVTASGNVSITEETGEVVFVQYAELSGDLKDGFILEVRMILEDGAKLAANKAKREKGEKSTFDQGVYSPCKVCKKTPGRDPIWQIKARRVLWDEVKEDIIYTDAFFEFFGIPLLYTPYLSHAAPTVKRRTGILAPVLGGSSNLGGLVALPFYWEIADNKDATITPMFIGKNVFMLGAEYRQRFSAGLFNISGSVTKGDRIAGTNQNPEIQSSTYRWHVLSDGRFNLDRHWRTGFEIERASDQTYLRRHTHLGLPHKNTLVSKGYVEGFYGKTYATAKMYDFQGLREGDRSETTPIIFPLADFNYVSDPKAWGGIFTFDSNFLALTRREGTEMGRASFAGGWFVPYLSSWGEVYTFGVRLRGDVYHVGNFKSSEADPPSGDRIVRGFPQAYANWRFPFVKTGGESTRYVVEPIAGVVLGPNIGRSSKLPTEDSRFIEFNDANFMSPDRFPGLDRIDVGSRVNYGLNLSVFRSEGKARLFFGQSAAFHEPRDHLIGTGLEKQWSDYVGRADISFGDWVTVGSRALFDRATFRTRRHEFLATLGRPLLRLNIDYLVLPNVSFDPIDQGGEQLILTLSSQLTEYWRVSVSATRELGSGGGALSHGVGLNYTDECFTFETVARKLFYKDRDFDPGIEVLFRLVFKNLGEIQQGVSFGGRSAPERQEIRPQEG